MLAKQGGSKGLTEPLTPEDLNSVFNLSLCKSAPIVEAKQNRPSAWTRWVEGTEDRKTTTHSDRPLAGWLGH